MRKRKAPIAKNLVQNSVSGMFSAIEVHNKPTIRYRYEIVVLLVLNAWELALKAYLYKYHKEVKLFHKDGTTKPFETCLNAIHDKLGKEFTPIQENLKVLYGYRNQVAHFYIEELDPIVFSLISKNIIFYSDFIKKIFKIDLSEVSDLILLPIGFKRPISPIDYISTTSTNHNSSSEVKAFLQTIIDATSRLKDSNIQDAIFVDFKMNLTNVNRITNADLIAGVDNTQKNNLVFSINKESKKVVVSNQGEKIRVTRNMNEAQGLIYYEELQEGIFDEINNILDANRLLAKNQQRFMLGPALYYRIYSERQHVNYNIESYELLARTGAQDIYGPFLYWLTKLPANKIVDIIFDLYVQSKSPSIHNLLRIILVIGNEAVQLLDALLQSKYKSVTQKPDYYYTFQEQKKSKINNPILKALKVTPTQISIENYKYADLLKDPNLCLKKLSQESLNVFKGQADKRKLARELDFLAYGGLLINNESIISELKRKEEFNPVIQASINMNNKTTY